MDSRHRAASILLALALLGLAACSKNPARPVDGDRNQSPETELTYAPVEGDTTAFRVHLYWYGYDRDGQVVRFRLAIDSDTTRAFSLWHATTAHDSVITLSVTPGGLVGSHVFWVIAVDNDGAFDPTPAKRTFWIGTAPPVTEITSGPASGSSVDPTVTFTWKGTDPDGGKDGTPTSVDSFEYILLRPGFASDPNHPPLPSLRSLADYENLLSRATGPSLPPPNDDWKWVATSADSHTLEDLASGYSIFAVRSVDAAGARDARLAFGPSIRLLHVGSGSTDMTLTLRGDLLMMPVQFRARFPWRFPVGVMEGDPATFQWFGTLGPMESAPIAGYSAALDDTASASWSELSLKKLGFTLPSDLSPGPHDLYIRAVQTNGATALASIALNVVHPAFRDPPSMQPPTVLCVDDMAPPPGDWNTALRGSPNYPTDPVEDDWWSRVILDPLSVEYGVQVEPFDAVYLGTFSIENRRPPTLTELARCRVVIWSADFNNTSSIHTAWFNALFGQASSALIAYLRGGGTLIVNGFGLASQSCISPSLPYNKSWIGMCGTLQSGSFDWDQSRFLREIAGIDAGFPSDVARRSNGARDFVEARSTLEGMRLGFHAATVDTGGAASGAKWDPYAFLLPSNPDATLAPGLPKIEGWNLESSFGCSPDEGQFRKENPALPIAVPIYRYHGVDKGVLLDGGPSPREQLVIGIATQAHDGGDGDRSIITPGNARGVVGRMVFLGFPVYYLKDELAYQVMRTAFEYVNASPTLPAGAP